MKMKVGTKTKHLKLKTKIFIESHQSLALSTGPNPPLGPSVHVLNSHSPTLGSLPHEVPVTLHGVDKKWGWGVSSCLWVL